MEAIATSKGGVSIQSETPPFLYTAFEPNNLAPGTGPNPDKVLLARLVSSRLVSYADPHRTCICTS